MGGNLLGGGRLGSEEDDYVEEIDYSPMKKSFLDRISLPGIMIAGGCLVLVLLLSFFFVRLQTSGLQTRMAALEERIQAQENRLVNLDGVPDLLARIEAQGKQAESLSARINRVEATLPTIVDQVKKELDSLQKKTAELKSSPAADKPAGAPKPKSGAPVYHTVGKGETLYGITRTYQPRYGLSMQKIREINKLGPNEAIRPGQKLIVGP